MTNQTLTTSHNRKSVRKYLDKPVERDVLETLMRAGMAAPSAANHRPWAFVAITERPTLVALANGLHYGKMAEHAAAAIVVCGDLGKALPGLEQDFWVQDCSAASQNILLAVESIGLGATWGGVYPMADRVALVQSVLNLPKEIIPLNIIAIGYPVGNELPHDKFDAAKIHWEKW